MNSLTWAIGASKFVTTKYAPVLGMSSTAATSSSGSGQGLPIASERGQYEGEAAILAHWLCTRFTPLMSCNKKMLSQNLLAFDEKGSILARKQGFVVTQQLQSFPAACCRQGSVLYETEQSWIEQAPAGNGSTCPPMSSPNDSMRFISCKCQPSPIDVTKMSAEKSGT